MGSVIVRPEDELALRSDHPHPVAHGQFPEQRRERPALDEPDVELIPLGADDGRRGRHRIRSLHDLAVDHDPDCHVLAAHERGGLAVESDPEVGQRVRLVLAADEPGVVDGRLGVDHPRLRRHEVGHGGILPGETGRARRLSSEPFVVRINTSWSGGAAMPTITETFAGFRPRPSSSSLTSPRTTTEPGSSRARATTSGS